jgi:hypothetical protein
MELIALSFVGTFAILLAQLGLVVVRHFRLMQSPRSS